ncbi:MAG: SRPBCC family protein [Verrucomicrobia bacterium]|nr:SRPBCC family protein [Verrucomicrobiota bacterium]
MAILARKRDADIDRSRISVPDNRGVKIVKTCTINRSPQELFQFWRRFENLPQVMEHVISVEQLSEKESHWVASTGKKKFEWNSLVINEHPNELIAWRTLDGSDVMHAGSVRFTPVAGTNSTEVTVQFEYEPPAGKVGVLFAKLFGKEPGRQVEKDLEQFKTFMETGETQIGKSTL